MHKKTKGSIAEMLVASKLMEGGWNVLFPFGENNRYDLVAEKNGKFVKVQVKYVTPVNGGLSVSCKSSNNWSVDKYTPEEVDFIAVYNSGNGRIYFVPSSRFNTSSIKLRITPTKNKQKASIKHAEDFVNFDENIGEVPERSNGPDCVERSVLKKFRMEKRVNSGEPLAQKC